MFMLHVHVVGSICAYVFMQDIPSVTLDRWFWGQQGGGAGGGGCLKLGVGSKGVREGCLHALERERNGVYCGGRRGE